MSKGRIVVSGLVVAISSRGAVGQYVVNHRVDGGSVRHKSEPALRMCGPTKEVMVAWHEHFNPSVQVHYNVWAIDASGFRTDPGIIPGTNSQVADPMVAFDSNGMGWVGCFNRNSPTNFWLAPKTAGAQYVQTAIPIFDQNVDKGVLVAGPPPGGGADQLNLFYAWMPQPIPPNDSSRLRGMISPPAPSSFAVGPSGGNHGGPNGAVIVRNQPTMLGHIVVAYAAPEPVPTPAEPLPNVYEPRATRSTDGGASWVNSINPTRAAKPSAAAQYEDIVWFRPVPRTTPPNADPYPNVLPELGPYVFNTPSLAADRSNESTMYMAFLGRTLSTSVLTPQNFDNIDLMIAQSIDGGADFSGNPLGSQVLHITDADLGDPPGSIQFLPAITVDGSGGVHVFYYVAWLDGVWKFQVKLATIPVFRVQSPRPTIQFLELTPPFDMEGSPSPSLSDNRRFFGEYIQADSWKCDVWGAFVAREAGQVAVSTFASQVNFCMDADANRDGAVNTLDPSQFAHFYALNDSRADLNHNSLVEAGDITRFLESYSCACNP